jgi:hypothetical protein
MDRSLDVAARSSSNNPASKNNLRRLHFEHDIGMNRAIDWIRRYVASLGNPSVVNEYKKAQQILAALDAGPEEKGVSCGHMG